MDQIMEIIQKYVDKDYDELYKIAQTTYNDLFDILYHVYYDEDDANSVLYNILLLCINADGKVDDLEIKFFNQLTDQCLDRAGMEEVLRDVDLAENLEIIDELFDESNEKSKAKILLLCVCTCVIDEQFDRQEYHLLDRLMSDSSNVFSVKKKKK